VSVTPLGQSNIVKISATASSPPQAARIANGYADSIVSLRTRMFQREVTSSLRQARERLKVVAAESGKSSLPAKRVAQRVAILSALVGEQDPTLSVLTSAAPPSSASWPRPKLSIAIAIVCGLVLGAILAFLLDLVRPVVRDEKELRTMTPAPILARTPYVAGAGSALVPGRVWRTMRNQAEAFRMLRNALARRDPEGGFPGVVVVTSAGSREGKTATALGLAEALARAGSTVVVVDGQLHDPAAPRPESSVSRTGRDLAAVLRGEFLPQAALVPGPVPNIRVLPGSSDPSLPDLLEPPAVAAALSRLQEQADVVVVDTSHLDGFAGAYAFAAAADAVVLCVRLGHARHDQLDHVLGHLAQLGILPTGVVVVSRRALVFGDRLPDRPRQSQAPAPSRDRVAATPSTPLGLARPAERRRR
jgi:Mrp family chromosome partitioning ATPase